MTALRQRRESAPPSRARRVRPACAWLGPVVAIDSRPSDVALRLVNRGVDSPVSSAESSDAVSARTAPAPRAPSPP